jgi:TatD DNase family protein
VIDSHCHLADEAFAADLPDVVERARTGGVTGALCILGAGDEPERQRSERLRELWPEVRFAVGVHPHVAGRYTRPEDAVRQVEADLDADPLVRAIGEIGLDYHYDFSPRDAQRAVFAAQIRLARERSLPVIIHTREADADTLEVLENEGLAEVRGIFHCFTGDQSMALRAVALGFHVSFAGILTFPRAEGMRQAARVVPDHLLLAETDSPYLAPVPHRGRRNEPLWVARTFEKLAEVRRESLATLVGLMDATYERLVRP